MTRGPDIFICQISTWHLWTPALSTGIALSVSLWGILTAHALSFGFNYLQYCLKPTGGASWRPSWRKVALEHKLSPFAEPRFQMGLKPLFSLNRHRWHEYHAATRGFCSLGGDGMVTVLSSRTRPAGESLQTGIRKGASLQWWLSNFSISCGPRNNPPSPIDIRKTTGNSLLECFTTFFWQRQGRVNYARRSVCVSANSLFD